MSRIVFIGAGNMGGAMIAGLLDHDDQMDSITIVERDQAKHHSLRQQDPSLSVVETIAEAVDGVDAMILAIKPQQMDVALHDLATALKGVKTLVISIAAGVSCARMQAVLGEEQSIVRCMPNTAALIKQSASGVFANDYVLAEQKNLADRILRAMGLVCWVDKEEDIDTVTALSGSGPAYFFLLMEAMQQAAQQLGLSADVAQQLTLQTGVGATQLAQQSSESLTVLRERVTSPGGTTEAALSVLLEKDFKSLLNGAITAAKQRALALR